MRRDRDVSPFMEKNITLALSFSFHLPPPCNYTARETPAHDIVQHDDNAAAVDGEVLDRGGRQVYLHGEGDSASMEGWKALRPCSRIPAPRFLTTDFCRLFHVSVP
jgi:hypothetical protein